MNHPTLSLAATIFAAVNSLLVSHPSTLHRIYIQAMKFFSDSDWLRDDIEWKETFVGDGTSGGNMVEPDIIQRPCIPRTHRLPFSRQPKPRKVKSSFILQAWPLWSISLQLLNATISTWRSAPTSQDVLTSFLSRWIPENGEMNWELSSGIPDNISACFSLYINFNR